MRRICSAAIAQLEDRFDRLDLAPATLRDMHACILNVTGVEIVRVETDEDLKRVSEDCARTQPLRQYSSSLEFSSNTEALIFRQNAKDPRRARFTAIVDARGNRRRRAWFAQRHEPAHLLVPDDAARTTWRRTNADRPEPVEQVIDAIAARIGFWEPIVRPVLRRTLAEAPNVLGPALDSLPTCTEYQCQRCPCPKNIEPTERSRSSVLVERAQPRNCRCLAESLT